MSIGELICDQRYSEEERLGFSKTIKDFNALYYRMGIQTWSSMFYRGVNVLKTPSDMWIYQELIYQTAPDVIIECGTFYGGSALYLVDMCEMADLSTTVLSIDITHEHIKDTVWQRADDRMNTNTELMLVLGSSTDDSTIEIVETAINNGDKVMVILDSDHTYAHVSNELEVYAPMVSKGCALIVEDTNCEDVRLAVDDWYLDNTELFKRDRMCEKFMLTFCRDGFFERV